MLSSIPRLLVFHLFHYGQTCYSTRLIEMSNMSVLAVGSKYQALYHLLRRAESRNSAPVVRPKFAQWKTITDALYTRMDIWFGTSHCRGPAKSRNARDRLVTLDAIAWALVTTCISILVRNTMKQTWTSYFCWRFRLSHYVKDCRHVLRNMA